MTATFMTDACKKSPWLKRAGTLLGALIFALIACVVDYAITGGLSTGRVFNKYWFIFFFACGLCVLVLFIYRKEIAQNPDIYFLALVLTITVGSSLVIDINEPSWDTENHFKFMLSWTEPDLTVDATNAEADVLTAPSIETQTNVHEIEARADRLNSADSTSSDIVVSSAVYQGYNRIASIPAAIIYAVAKAMGVAFSVRYVLARLIYAVIFSLVCYLGIKRLRSGKMIYASIALLPTVLFLASEYSYDYWVIAWILCAVAYVIGEMQRPDELLTLKRSVQIFGFFILACGPKAIYFPLVLLCLLMPKSKFKSKAQRRLFIGASFATALLILASFLAPFVVGVSADSITNDTRLSTDTNQAGQVHYVLSHLFTYLGVLFNFLVYYLGPFDIGSFTTSYAYLPSSGRLPIAVAAAMMIFTCVTDKTGKDALICNWKSRTWVAILLYGTLCLVASALYVSFNPVGASTIQGCQGRYMIPCLFPALFFFGMPQVAAKIRKCIPYYNTICLAVMSLLPLYCMWVSYVGLMY